MLRILLLPLIVAAIVSIIAKAPTAHAAKLELGDTPPDYLGRDGDGNKVLVSDHPGKVLVVTFWATWCPPCLVELPVLEAIQRQVGHDQLRIIAVNYRQDKRLYRKTAKRMSDFEILLTHDRGKAAKAYGVKSLPHMFMISRKGVIAQIHLGYGEGMHVQIIDEINRMLMADVETTEGT